MSTRATFESILKEISSQTNTSPPEAMEELSLDGLEIITITPELQSHLEKFKNLIALSMNECSLNSLENFPKLTNLARLELCDNELTSSSLPALTSLKGLQSISLGGNSFKTVEELAPLKSLENLTDLDLLGCDLEDREDFRERVFEYLPRLMILNNFDREGNDLDMSKDEEELDKIAPKVLITKEVIILSSDDEEEQQKAAVEEVNNKGLAPKDAEEYFRKVVFKEKFNGKYETFEVKNSKKKRSDDGRNEEESEEVEDIVKKKVKI